jgi:hypothetical protein
LFGFLTVPIYLLWQVCRYCIEHNLHCKKFKNGYYNKDLSIFVFLIVFFYTLKYFPLTAHIHANLCNYFYSAQAWTFKHQNAFKLRDTNVQFRCLVPPTTPKGIQFSRNLSRLQSSTPFLTILSSSSVEVSDPNLQIVL